MIIVVVQTVQKNVVKQRLRRGEFTPLFDDISIVGESMRMDLQPGENDVEGGAGTAERGAKPIPLMLPEEISGGWWEGGGARRGGLGGRAVRATGVVASFGGPRGFVGTNVEDEYGHRAGRGVIWHGAAVVVAMSSRDTRHDVVVDEGFFFRNPMTSSPKYAIVIRIAIDGVVEFAREIEQLHAIDAFSFHGPLVHWILQFVPAAGTAVAMICVAFSSAAVVAIGHRIAIVTGVAFRGSANAVAATGGIGIVHDDILVATLVLVAAGNAEVQKLQKLQIGLPPKTKSRIPVIRAVVVIVDGSEHDGSVHHPSSFRAFRIRAFPSIRKLSIRSHLPLLSIPLSYDLRSGIDVDAGRRKGHFPRSLLLLLLLFFVFVSVVTPRHPHRRPIHAGETIGVNGVAAPHEGGGTAGAEDGPEGLREGRVGARSDGDAVGHGERVWMLLLLLLRWWMGGRMSNGFLSLETRRRL
mmetsp:Transcript_25149/g.53001  ORF Transcript_25149/g.53001 Transcript_25149/m.53001 type:complete len:467 (+) Transcript_25149:2109-3509(+)